MTQNKKKVKLVADDVNAADRYVFNLAASFEDESRGQVISKLLREFAERTFGKESVAAKIRVFEERERAKAGEKMTSPVSAAPKTSGLD